MAPKRVALLVSALIMILASPLPPSASHWLGLSVAAAEESKEPEPFDHRYPDWSAALRVLVRDGRVDYKAAASSRPPQQLTPFRLLLVPRAQPSTIKRAANVLGERIEILGSIKVVALLLRVDEDRMLGLSI